MESILQIIYRNFIYILLFIYISWRIYRYINGRKLIKEILKREDYQLLDVRSRGEYQSFSIPNSVNIPVGEISQSYSQLDKEKPIIVYCASGTRSAMARMQLLRLGFKEVVNGGGVYGISKLIPPLR